MKKPLSKVKQIMFVLLLILMGIFLAEGLKPRPPAEAKLPIPPPFLKMTFTAKSSVALLFVLEVKARFAYSFPECAHRERFGMPGCNQLVCAIQMGDQKEYELNRGPCKEFEQAALPLLKRARDEKEGEQIIKNYADHSKRAFKIGLSEKKRDDLEQEYEIHLENIPDGLIGILR